MASFTLVFDETYVMMMKMRLSKFTIFFGIYIIASSFFMRQVWTIWKDVFGLKNLILFISLLCLLAILAILYKNIKSGFNIKRMLFVLAICIAGFIFAWRQPYLSEKAHVLEFALLGWLAMQDLSKENRDLLKASLIALIFVIIIGCLEEGYQKLLPWRVGELRDIITDVISGMFGIILNSLSQTRLSAFIRPLRTPV